MITTTTTTIELTVS